MQNNEKAVSINFHPHHFKSFTWNVNFKSFKKSKLQIDFEISNWNRYWEIWNRCEWVLFSGNGRKWKKSEFEWKSITKICTQKLRLRKKQWWKLKNTSARFTFTIFDIINFSLRNFYQCKMIQLLHKIWIFEPLVEKKRELFYMIKMENLQNLLTQTWPGKCALYFRKINPIVSFEKCI